MLKTLTKYIEKQALYPPLIEHEPSSDLKNIITIPCFNEPNINNTLQSILACKQAQHSIEVIVLINNSTACDQYIKTQNQQTFNEIKKWNTGSDKITIHAILINDLKPKHAGAGSARKIAMDEAIHRFIKIKQAQGIITSLDADTLVSENYLQEIENAFSNTKKIHCAIFNFQHRLNEIKYGFANTKAIIEYELYLNYYKQALKHTAFPYAYFTIGSCFAISAESYTKQGGMNRKKAGEDFYFLQKIFALGKTKELNKVWVYPSARPSNRVPFGTGPAIRQIATEGTLLTYECNAFLTLQAFFNNITSLFKLNENLLIEKYTKLDQSLQAFIPEHEWTNALLEISANSATVLNFNKRFFTWFNGLKIIQYLNFTHQTYYTKSPIEIEANKFLMAINQPTGHTTIETLNIYRNLTPTKEN